MSEMVAFINLFFVPVVCLYLVYRKNEKPIEISIELLFQYCIITACNVPAAKVLGFLVKHITGIQFFIDSGYYTLTALVSAVLMAWLFVYARIEIVIEKNGAIEAED